MLPRGEEGEGEGGEGRRREGSRLRERGRISAASHSSRYSYLEIRKPLWDHLLQAGVAQCPGLVNGWRDRLSYSSSCFLSYVDLCFGSPVRKKLQKLSQVAPW